MIYKAPKSQKELGRIKFT